MGLYQDPQTSCGSRTRAGDVSGVLHRRYSPDGRVRGEVTRPSGRLGIPVTMSGLQNKCGEDDTRPSRSLVFLGFSVDTTKMEFSLLSEKIKKIRAEARKLLGLDLVSAHLLARLVGKMNATSQVIPPAPLFFWHIQMDLSATLISAAQDYETQLSLTQDSRQRTGLVG